MRTLKVVVLVLAALGLVGLPSHQTSLPFQKTSLRFEPNAGQYDGDFEYVMRGAGYTAFFFADRVTFVAGSESGEMRFNNSATSSITASKQLSGYSNYYLGNDPARWRTEIPHYGRLTYADVWPDTQITFYFNGNSLEYDIEVGPDGNLENVAYELDGVSLITNDRLVANLGDATLQHRIHNAFRHDRQSLTVTFEDRDGVIRFESDVRSNLTIDPVIEFATYLGGSNTDYGWAVGANSSDVWLVGQTSATDFPTANAYQSMSGGGGDIFVTRMNEQGLIFSTYFGGSGNDDCFSRIDVSTTTEEVAITGVTNSTNLPTAGNPQPLENMLQGGQDAFTAKFSPQGMLEIATYIGGSLNDYGGSVAIAADGDLIVAGRTVSTDFPTSLGVFQETLNGTSADVFVFRLQAAGNGRVWSTLLGGTGVDGGVTDIELDPDENIIIGGTTNSTDFPQTSAGAQPDYGGGLGDVFIAKLLSNATALEYATYWGGTGNENLGGIDLTQDSRACVGASTGSADLPTTPGVYQETLRGVSDFAVACLSSDGSEFAFSTYVGGSQGEGYGDIGVLPDGGIAMGFLSGSDDIPVSYQAH